MYAHTAGTAQTTEPLEFAEWYETLPGVNYEFEVELPLEDGDGVYTYASRAFFPLKPTQGFGADIGGFGQNFNFTTEIHTEFLYKGGETFRFTGDDDMWIFINGQLVIDLEELHPELSSQIDLDDRADELGLEPGLGYTMDIFHAERPDNSNFRIDTSIACFRPPAH